MAEDQTQQSRRNTARPFIPRDRSFWLYHCTALAAWGIVQSFAIYTRQSHLWFNITGSLLWIPLYTFGVLFFRFHYQKYQWYRLPTPALITIALAYSLAIGAFVTVVTMSITLPVYWDSVFQPHTTGEAASTNLTIFTRILLLNTVVTQLYASVWTFIYINVTSNRHTREIELRNLRLENRLKEAQLSNLSRQLNPHFLFNSLNNIRFMIHENPAYADRTITALSEILRYALQSGRADEVTLREELDIVNRYVEVVALQLEERMDFQLSVADGLDRCLVPPMMLQLLVENAVKHGIENAKGTGILSVRICTSDRSLHMTVSNPLPPVYRCPTRNTGTGLKNIEQRLRLLYGRAGRLRVSRDGGRFSVQIAIPENNRS